LETFSSIIEMENGNASKADTPKKLAKERRQGSSDWQGNIEKPQKRKGHR
jgi:hypothetical protein